MAQPMPPLYPDDLKLLRLENIAQGISFFEEEGFCAEDVGLFDPVSRSSEDFDQVVMHGDMPVWKGSFNFLNSAKEYAMRGPEYERALLDNFWTLLRGRALNWFYMELFSDEKAQLRSLDGGLNLWCTKLTRRFGVSSNTAIRLLGKERFTLQNIADMKSFEGWISRLGRISLAGRLQFPFPAEMPYYKLDDDVRLFFPSPGDHEMVDEWVPKCKPYITQLYTKCTQGSWRHKVQLTGPRCTRLNAPLHHQSPESALCIFLERRFTLQHVAEGVDFGIWAEELMYLARAAKFEPNQMSLLFYTKLDVHLREAVRPPAPDESLIDWIEYCDERICLMEAARRELKTSRSKANKGRGR